MKSSPEYLKQAFNTQREQWEKQLQSELKIEDVASKTVKKNEGQNWPTLSLNSTANSALSVNQKWKKAAQTYAVIPKNINDLLKDDLNNGVRSFFFFAEFLDQAKWTEIEKSFLNFSKRDECEVFFIGPSNIKSQFKVLNDTHILHGREIEHAGGSVIQELALMTLSFIQNLKDEKEFNLGVYVDSQFFKNIAKIRAAKLLAFKVLEASDIKAKVNVIALSSFREWTLFERYSNMLRNDIAVASAFIGGADSVQSSGYQTLFDLEVGVHSIEHQDRSLRMARNTSHILALESMVGVVEDPAHGSFHLESLTQHYASSAWQLMQTSTREEILTKASEFANSRIELLKKRKTVLVGINDFPDVKETLNIIPQAKFFRLARPFEELRIKMEAPKHKPQVHIALYGDYASLSARVNFIKNYFELLGLSVSDPSHNSHDMNVFIDDLNNRKEEILVLCASDDKYSELAPRVSGIKVAEKFLAGKAEITGFTSIFSGQDVYSILEPLVKRWSK